MKHIAEHCWDLPPREGWELLQTGRCSPHSEKCRICTFALSRTLCALCHGSSGCSVCSSPAPRPCSSFPLHLNLPVSLLLRATSTVWKCTHIWAGPAHAEMCTVHTHNSDPTSIIWCDQIYLDFLLVCQTKDFSYFLWLLSLILITHWKFPELHLFFGHWLLLPLLLN